MKRSGSGPPPMNRRRAVTRGVSPPGAPPTSPSTKGTRKVSQSHKGGKKLAAKSLPFWQTKEARAQARAEVAAEETAAVEGGGAAGTAKATVRVGSAVSKSLEERHDESDLSGLGAAGRQDEAERDAALSSDASDHSDAAW